MPNNTDDQEQVTCDPGFCIECLYLGEGDFICMDDRFKNREFTIDSWERTDHFDRCKGKYAEYEGVHK